MNQFPILYSGLLSWTHALQEIEAVLSARKVTESWKVRTGKDRFFFSNLQSCETLSLRKIWCGNPIYKQIRTDLWLKCGGGNGVLEMHVFSNLYTPDFHGAQFENHWCLIPLLQTENLSPEKVCDFPRTAAKPNHTEVFSLAYFWPFPLKCGLFAVRECFYKQEGNGRFVLLLLLLEEKCVKKKSFEIVKLRFCTEKLSPSWKKRKWASSKSLEKQRERELSVQSASTLSLSPQPRVCLSSDCVWPSVKLNENLSEQVSGAFLLRKGLAQFLGGKGKRKI